MNNNSNKNKWEFYKTTTALNNYVNKTHPYLKRKRLETKINNAIIVALPAIFSALATLSIVNLILFFIER